MPTFKITLAYDGTDFVGWQRQAAGSSVQALVETALAELADGPVRVTAAGRTDAGVHALGQVAGLTLERTIAPDALVRAINARLPPAVRVLSAEPVPPSFHARFAAVGKTYRYRIWNADVLCPFERRHAWHVPGVLDVDAMDAAARLVVGQHDFSAFQGAGGTTHTAVRVVTASDVRRPTEGVPLVIYDVSGTGFLRHMVRNLVGTLVEIGRVRHPPEWMAQVLHSRDRAQAGRTAPPEGLFLVAVDYGDALATGS